MGDIEKNGERERECMGGKREREREREKERERERKRRESKKRWKGESKCLLSLARASKDVSTVDKTIPKILKLNYSFYFLIK